MSKVPLFFIIVVAIIVIAASFRYRQQRSEKAANDAAPLRQKSVVVSNKWQTVVNDRRSRQQEVTPAGTGARFAAGFTPENGGPEIIFRLNERQYRALTVGDKGKVSYQGSRFIGFVLAPR